MICHIRDDFDSDQDYQAWYVEQHTSTAGYIPTQAEIRKRASECRKQMRERLKTQPCRGNKSRSVASIREYNAADLGMA